MVGDSDRVYLPDIGRQRAGQSRFRGVRLIRTNLRGDLREVELTRDDLTDLSQLQLDMVMTIAVGPGGYPGACAWAYLIPPNPDDQLYATAQAVNPSAITLDFQAFIGELEGEFQRRTERTRRTGGTPAMLVYVTTPDDRGVEVELAEMRELCRTAGVDIVATEVQNRTDLHPRYAVGRGKLEDLTQRSLQLDAELIIFGQDLSPGQLRAITAETELGVIDRTQLILDIFAQHAKSRDGKLQVELAQLRYNLPRLSDKSTGMSRLTGGIGGRGPGETKLEINRRRAHDRIRQLEREIKRLSQHRALRRRQRAASADPNISIVGYTNAGKSTLLNHLTTSNVFSEDLLFATLRPTTRRLELPDQQRLIFTDTVGFIHDLPPDLINAFKATLEELAEADLLLHVVDASQEGYDERMLIVDRLLKDLALPDRPHLLVFNKIDLLPSDVVTALRRRYDAITVSALDHTTFPPLIEAIQRELASAARRE